MTTTEAPAAHHPTAPAAAAPPKLRRRPALAILGIGLIAAGGLTAAAVVTSIDDSVSVLVPVETIYRGQTITSEDLTSAAVSGLPGAAVIPTGQADSIIGQTATVDLAAGVPITADSVTSQPVPGPGNAVVGLLMAPGQAPSVPLQPGDPVRVVSTPRAQDDAPPADSIIEFSATVVATTTDETSGNTIVNVQTDQADASRIAALAATGRVAVVLDAEEG